MEYTYPAGKGGAPWSKGAVPGPYAASPMAGKNGTMPTGAWPSQAGYPGYPAGYPAQVPMRPYPGAGKSPYAVPWAGKGGGAYPYGAPAPAPGQLSPYAAPPMYMYEMLPAVTGYDPREAPMILDLAAVIGPALSSVLPAIQGLLQIPSLIMEYGEGADLLSQWDDLTVTLTPALEAIAEGPDAGAAEAAETEPAAGAAEAKAEAPAPDAEPGTEV